MLSLIPYVAYSFRTGETNMREFELCCVYTVENPARDSRLSAVSIYYYITIV